MAMAGVEDTWCRYLRGWWAVGAVAACPIHCTKLIDCCSRCSRALVFDQGGLTRCRCDADLEQCSSDALERQSLLAEAYLVGRLGGADHLSVPLLDRLPLADVIALIPRLGSLKLLSSNGSFGRIRTADAGLLKVRGMEVAMSNDAGVECLLDATLRKNGPADSLRAQLGGFYEWFASLPAGALRNWLSERVGVTVGRRGILWTNWQKFVSGNPSPDRVSIAEAGAILDLTEQATRRVLTAVHLIPDDSRSSIRPSYDRSHVEALGLQLHSTLEVCDAAAQLGTTARSFRQLAAAGIIEPDHVAATAYGNAARFAPDSIAAILEKLVHGVPVRGTAPGGAIIFENAARQLGIVKLCRGLIEGTIRPVGRLSGRKSLDKLLISSNSIALMKLNIGKDYLCAKSAAIFLSLRERAFAALVSAGHLTPALYVSPYHIFCVNDLDEFARRYINHSELAVNFGTSTKQILSSIAEIGISPSIELYSSDRIEVRFYERRSVCDLSHTISVSFRNQALSVAPRRSRRSVSGDPRKLSGHASRRKVAGIAAVPAIGVGQRKRSRTNNMT
ncbi:hypothetical protein GOFOIKOB_5751 [Methylobacterium tardum]|nr:hypothetical protein GOFOIKOB_5751 [Methylobacterium tardum]